MSELSAIQKNMLKEIAGYEEIPEGAYNLRSNGALAGRRTTANIDIQTKTDKPGIDIIIKPGTKNERVDIPVILTETGLDDLCDNYYCYSYEADFDGHNKESNDALRAFINEKTKGLISN